MKSKEFGSITDFVNHCTRSLRKWYTIHIHRKINIVVVCCISFRRGVSVNGITHTHTVQGSKPYMLSLCSAASQFPRQALIHLVRRHCPELFPCPLMSLRRADLLEYHIPGSPVPSLLANAILWIGDMPNRAPSSALENFRAR
jgi:hypothetical protein